MRSFFIGYCFVLVSVSCIYCGQSKQTVLGLPTIASTLTLDKPRSTRSGHTLIFHVSAEPPSLHPTNSSFQSKWFIFRYLHRELLTYAPETSGVAPDLLLHVPTALPSDPSTYCYELKDSLFWDNNSPVTVEDIVFSFKANCCALVRNPYAKPTLEMLEQIVPDNNNPRKCFFKMRSASLLNQSFSIGFPILQRRHYDPLDLLKGYSFDDLRKVNTSTDRQLTQWAVNFNDGRQGIEASRIAGLGGYRLDRWEKGRYLILVKKRMQQNSPSQVYSPDTILVRFLKEPVSVLAALREKTIDGSYSLPEEVFMQAMIDSTIANNYHLGLLRSWRFSLVEFNTRTSKAFLTDQRVRKALALLIPYEQLTSAGINERMPGYLFPENIEFDSTLRYPSYQPREAIQLLEAAGWTSYNEDGLRCRKFRGKEETLSFDFLAIPSQKELALRLATCWAKAGIQANVRLTDPALLVDRAEKHQFEALLNSFATDCLLQDPSQLWHSQSWANGGTNFCGFGSAESDAWIERIHNAASIEERYQWMQKLQAKINEEQPVIFLLRDMRFACINRALAQAALSGHKPFANLYNWKLQ